MTHQIARIVVRADSEEEALEKAMDVVEYNLLNYEVSEGRGRDGPFDYVKKMERGHTVSGSDRWQQYATTPMAFEADTEAGREEIETGWEIAYEELADKLTRIRSKMDDATIEELANDEGMRADMHGCAPWTPGVNHYLFDATKYGETHLEPVSTPDKFDELLSDLEGKWVVPLDAHW